MKNTWYCPDLSCESGSRDPRTTLCSVLLQFEIVQNSLVDLVLDIMRARISWFISESSTQTANHLLYYLYTLKLAKEGRAGLCVYFMCYLWHTQSTVLVFFNFAMILKQDPSVFRILSVENSYPFNT